MFFEVQEKVREVSVDQINPDYITTGLISLEELPQMCVRFGFSPVVAEECTTRHSSRSGDLYVYDTFSFGVLNIINARDVLGKKDRVGLFIRKNLFLVVTVTDDDLSIHRIFEETVVKLSCVGVTLEKLVCAFLERTVYQNREDLEEIESSIERIEDNLVAGRPHRAINAYLTTQRRKLLALRDYYEQLIDVGEQLQGNSNGLFDDKRLRYFEIFTNRVTRMSANTQLLRDYLTQVRDAYQASLDYNLNRFMRVSTIMTTLCLPLTLITGWYGMNFARMPELSWQYGYPTVMLLATAVIVFCLWMFKKQKFL